MEQSIRIRKKDDKIHLGRNRLFRELGELDNEKDYAVKIQEWKDSRSLRQNRLYWKWLSVIGEELGYYKDELHELFIEQFSDIYTIRDLEGKPKQKRVRTSQMSVEQMSEYLNRIEQFAAENGIKLPTPDEDLI